MRKLLSTLPTAICFLVIGLWLYRYGSPPQKATSLHKSQVEISDDAFVALLPTADELEVSQLLVEGCFDQALAIIKQHKEEMESQSDRGKRWLDLLAEVCEQRQDLLQLQLLCEYEPRLLEEREKSCLLLAEGRLHDGDLAGYRPFSAIWLQRADRSPQWTFLEVEALLLDEKRAEAMKLLEESSFAGEEEVGRLVRLGLLHALVEPQKSWYYFSEAIYRNPEQGSLHLYRAHLAEAAGSEEIATEEFEMAVAKSPADPECSHQLAEYELRHGRCQHAVEVWAESTKQTKDDSCYLKALFWSKMAHPLDDEALSDSLPQGELQPLLAFLSSLPADRVWDEAKFSSIPAASVYLETQQETHWLRLVQLLSEGSEQQALTLIEQSPFSATYESWHPQLDIALLRLLQWRRTGGWHLGGLETMARELYELGEGRAMGRPEASLLGQIEQWARSDEEPSEGWKKLLESPEAFSSLFLVAGWPMAAIYLQTGNPIPADFPPWYVEGLAQAHVDAFGNDAALAFISQQPASRGLKAMMARLLVEEGLPFYARLEAEPLAQLDHPLDEQQRGSSYFTSYEERPKAEEAVVAKQQREVKTASLQRLQEPARLNEPFSSDHGEEKESEPIPFLKGKRRFLENRQASSLPKLTAWEEEPGYREMQAERVAKSNPPSTDGYFSKEEKHGMQDSPCGYFCKEDSCGRHDSAYPANPSLRVDEVSSRAEQQVVYLEGPYSRPRPGSPPPILLYRDPSGRLR